METLNFAGAKINFVQRLMPPLLMSFLQQQKLHNKPVQLPQNPLGTQIFQILAANQFIAETHLREMSAKKALLNAKHLSTGKILIFFLKAYILDISLESNRDGLYQNSPPNDLEIEYLNSRIQLEENSNLMTKTFSISAILGARSQENFKDSINNLLQE